ncbi:NUDIX hydrolase [Spirillospora sp. CA-294931]|uniref:NUDIX hydrolase n=1 Tax=Spirillospora sp. CA-294931 TaxID=3240042 RepID=UPI003D9217ED
MRAYRRRSARVLLVDGAGRLLLFRFPGLNGGHIWLTPGGGVDEGEPLHAAAARELREETGLAVTPDQLGPRVAVTSGYADLGWARGVFRDDFFLHRTGAHEVDLGGLEAHERDMITAHRWWSLDELHSTGETVYPFGLAPLLARLLEGRVPASPVRLPWHH